MRILKKIVMRRISYHYSNMIKDYLRILFFDNKDEKHITHFEEKFAEHLGIPATVCTSFGCHALSVALDFYKIDKTKKVLLPSYTAKVVEQVLIEKEIPYVAVDIDPLTANISHRTLQEVPLNDCAAIIITHLFGVVVQKNVIDYCRHSGLIVIEDCAHAQGAKFDDGTPVGTYGDAGFFSFGYSKIINTYTGGLLASHNKKLIEFARAERAQHKKPSVLRMLQRLLFANAEKLFVTISWIPFIKYFLYNENILRSFKTNLNYIVCPKVTAFFKYTNAQAYIGLKQLGSLEQNLDHRKQISQLYENKLDRFRFLKRKSGDVYYNQIVILDMASRCRQKLLSLGIDSGTGPSVMEKIKNRIQSGGVDFALSSYLQIPLSSEIDAETVDQICKKLEKISRK